MAAWGSQYSTGDQGNAKLNFWRSGFKICQKCKGNTIKSKEVPAGCRMNGDGYGTEEFSCQTCGWKTSFQYDEASSPYYYETRGWERTEKKAVQLPPVPLDSELVKKFKRIQKIVDKRALVDAMRSDRISPQDIQKFLRKYPYPGEPALPELNEEVALLKASAAEAAPDYSKEGLLKKYNHLMSVLPESSVRSLMEQDGVPADAITAFFAPAQSET